MKLPVQVLEKETQQLQKLWIAVARKAENREVDIRLLSQPEQH